MRLLHIMAEMDPQKGGVGQAVRTMMTGLAEAGLQNEAVSLDSENSLFLTNNNLGIHALGPCNGPWSYSSKLLPWLIQSLSGYDVVIVHGLWLYHSYAVAKAIKVIKKQREAKKQQKGLLPRLFVMPHGMLDPYFQKAHGRRLKALRNWLYWKLIEGKLINGADGIFFTSLEEQRLARVPFRPYNPLGETVVGLGIAEPPDYSSSMKKAFSEKCPEINDRSYILYIGRIDEKKGIDLLIRAYIKCVEKHLETDKQLSGLRNQDDYKHRISQNSSLPKLVIAGPGVETSYGQKILQLSSGFELSIFFTGMLTADAKWGAFYECEAFILPSHQENFGIAVVEALACGKPVLISNQVNIWQEIKSSGAGLVESDTEEGTLKLLQYWIKLSDNEKQTMGQEALNCYKSKFSIGPATARVKDALIGMKVQ